MYPSDLEINVLLMRDLLVSRNHKRKKSEACRYALFESE